jgi:hypothetical protein
MREDHDRCAALESGEILLKPVQLRLAELSHALELNDVHQSNEVNAFVIETVPAVSFCSFAVTVQVHFSVID